MTAPTDECINHPAFPQPNRQDLKVWRYTSLSKFLSLLTTSKLYLTRLDQLNDPHEGSLPKTMIEIRDSAPTTRKTNHYSNFNQEVRQEIFVNCWTLQPNESEALWRLYGGSEEGIAIQSSYSKLIDIARSELFTYVGCVKYLDYDSDTFDSPEWPISWNLFQPAMHKRIAFAHEHEVRIIKSKHRKAPDDIQPIGYEITINLEELIENIYISPYAQEWYTNIVKSVLIKFYPELISKIKWSKMRAQPLY